MTARTVSAAMIAPTQARLGLTSITSLAALFAWLTYLFPPLIESGVTALTVRLFVHGIIALGLWFGVARTDVTSRQRSAIWIAIMAPFTLWAAVAWSGAINGVFRPGASTLPLLPMAIFVPIIIGAPLLLLSGRIGQLLDAMPATWLVALQVYRVFGSQWLVYWLLGVLPGIFAIPAGTGDVLTGVLAIPAAIAVAAGTTNGHKAAVLWNVFGIADFVVAITLGLITTPGPFQLIVPDELSIGVGTYPNVLTPAFVVPSSILLHLLSLRQLRRRRTLAERSA